MDMITEFEFIASMVWSHSECFQLRPLRPTWLWTRLRHPSGCRGSSRNRRLRRGERLNPSPARQALQQGRLLTRTNRRKSRPFGLPRTCGQALASARASAYPSTCLLWSGRSHQRTNLVRPWTYHLPQKQSKSDFLSNRSKKLFSLRKQNCTFSKHCEYTLLHAC